MDPNNKVIQELLQTDAFKLMLNNRQKQSYVLLHIFENKIKKNVFIQMNVNI